MSRFLQIATAAICNVMHHPTTAYELMLARARFKSARQLAFQCLIFSKQNAVRRCNDSPASAATTILTRVGVFAARAVTKRITSSPVR